MAEDPELVADTLAVRDGLGLDIIANDYIASESGRYLLEVNHIPSVTCLPELWEDYLGVVTGWARKAAESGGTPGAGCGSGGLRAVDERG